MGFSVEKAALYAATIFVGLGVVLTIANSHWPAMASVVFAGVCAIGSGAMMGYLMRDEKMEVAGASLQSVDCALSSAWSLRTFRPRPRQDGAVHYHRGFGIFGDGFTVFPTPTGVRLEGPFSVIRAVKSKAAA